ncbi:hypothetical protein BD626DRAFT_500631 [Schizophyllum amplum]|uniref:BTB domain-containing protein n=1 Tax=Schizophyllum amplum TaxID=97359 RepID=A0A550CAU8_9AGAR|nr:hypothetical protein BD626DRAFT_500631 [Auriculariopsis ampla]
MNGTAQNTFGNGLQNGSVDVNGAGSSHESPEHQQATSSAPLRNGFPGNHNEEIVEHLYQAGFQAGNYSDILLHVHQNMYRLHSIILSRSPYLAHLMSTTLQPGGQRAIYVPLDHDREVTPDGFAIALGYLYSSASLRLIHPENARAVLAAACLLGGMDDLCEFAYDVCRRSISLDNIGSWLDFVDVPEAAPGSATPIRAGTPMRTGTPMLPGTPTLASPPPLPQPTSLFGLYTQRLRGDVFNFLVVVLPATLDLTGANEDPSEPSGRDVLMQVFSRLPFEMFKSAVESPTFQFGTDQARFKFAKDTIEVRKRSNPRAAGTEETVVLAFGGGNFGGSAVHVTRKLKKKPLWKVSS